METNNTSWNTQCVVWPFNALNRILNLNLNENHALNMDQVYKITSLLSLNCDVVVDLSNSQTIEQTLANQLSACMLVDLTPISGMKQWYESIAELLKDAIKWKPKNHKRKNSNLSNKIYDIDLEMNIDLDIPRFYVSELLNICSNRKDKFFDYCLTNLGAVYESEYKLISLLKSSTKSYIDIDNCTLKKKNSTTDYIYVERNFKLCSNNLKLFQEICFYCTEKFPEKSQRSKKRKPIPSAVRSRVWERYFDTISGNCYCCQDIIKVNNWEAGHIISAADGGPDTEDNLVPICSSCNKSMGARNMLEYASQYHPQAPVLLLKANLKVLSSASEFEFVESRPSSSQPHIQEIIKIESNLGPNFYPNHIQEVVEIELDSNHMQLFLNLHLKNEAMEAKILHQLYQSWCKEQNYEAMSLKSKEFRASLKNHNIKAYNESGKRYYIRSK